MVFQDEKRGVYQDIPRLKQDIETIGADLAAEEIMKEVIEEKLKGRKRVVIITGHAHGPRLSRMLRKKYDVNFVAAVPPEIIKKLSSLGSQRSLRANILGKGKVVRSKGNIKWSLEPRDRMIAQTALMDMKATKWTMPNIYKKEHGKLVLIKKHRGRHH